MSPRTPQQFQVMRQRSESLILEAALELFATNGFHNTSIEKIRKKAGVSKGLIYNYFKSKDDLLERIIRMGMEVGDDLLEKALAVEQPKQSLKNIVNGLFDTLEQNPTHWKWMMALMMQPGIEANVKALIVENAEANLVKIETLFKKISSPKPRVNAILLLATLDGVGLHYLAGFTDYPLQAVKADIFERFDLLK